MANTSNNTFPTYYILNDVIGNVGVGAQTTLPTVSLSNTINVTPANTAVTVNWKLKNGNTVVKSSTTDGQTPVAGGVAKDILSWNTPPTDYNNYTLEFEVTEMTETPVNDVVNLTINNPYANVTAQWYAAGKSTPQAWNGNTASYTHSWTKRTDGANVVQNPAEGYFDNVLKLTGPNASGVSGLSPRVAPLSPRAILRAMARNIKSSHGPTARMAQLR